MGSITDILSSKDIDKAMADVEAGGFFQYKPFFRTSGLSSKSVKQVRKIYEFLDREFSGFIEEQELTKFLKILKHGARDLTPAETAAFMKAGDPNGTGKISPDAFAAMVRSSNQED
ncbi:parvalbumin beta-like [Phyllobates terribilis]|uniref:parvalbumin beta-like n=1 Tax=Phyllobates terribilis TaxID=111132 RepID=UPI003CCAD35F